MYTQIYLKAAFQKHFKNQLFYIIRIIIIRTVRIIIGYKLNPLFCQYVLSGYKRLIIIITRADLFVPSVDSKYDIAISLAAFVQGGQIETLILKLLQCPVIRNSNHIYCLLKWCPTIYEKRRFLPLNCYIIVIPPLKMVRPLTSSPFSTFSKFGR